VKILQPFSMSGGMKRAAYRRVLQDWETAFDVLSKEVYVDTLCCSTLVCFDRSVAFYCRLEQSRLSHQTWQGAVQSTSIVVWSS
jgi:hypothetical protein